MQYRLVRELRCPRCGKLLARFGKGKAVVQIKCARCGFLAAFN